jgi:hypothetical protein
MFNSIKAKLNFAVRYACSSVTNYLHCSKYMIMTNISGHEHVLILMDEAYFDGRMDLQKREIVKEYTGGRLVGKSPMLKLNHCV